MTTNFNTNIMEIMKMNNYDTMLAVCERLRNSKNFDTDYDFNLVSLIANKYDALLSDVGEALYE